MTTLTQAEQQFLGIIAARCASKAAAGAEITRELIAAEMVAELEREAEFCSQQTEQARAALGTISRRVWASVR